MPLRSSAGSCWAILTGRHGFRERRPPGRHPLISPRLSCWHRPLITLYYSRRHGADRQRAGDGGGRRRGRNRKTNETAAAGWLRSIAGFGSPMPIESIRHYIRSDDADLLLRQRFQLVAKPVMDKPGYRPASDLSPPVQSSCTPINCQPTSVFSISGEPLSPGNVSHWCESTLVCAQPVTIQSVWV